MSKTDDKTMAIGDLHKLRVIEVDNFIKVVYPPEIKIKKAKVR